MSDPSKSADEPLTGILAEIADVLDREAALKIAEAVGGTYVYIPALVPDEHWLVECVGKENALKLCKHFTFGRCGIKLDVPLISAGSYSRFMLAQQAAIDADIKSGKLKPRQIARKHRVTERTVFRRRRLFGITGKPGRPKGMRK
jgi:hypothetical protein